MLRTVSSTLLAGHDVVGVQVTVCLAYALEQGVEVEALVLQVQPQAIRVAGDGAADDGLVVGGNLVVVVDVGLLQVTRMNGSAELRAIGIDVVSFLL